MTCLQLYTTFLHLAIPDRVQMNHSLISRVNLAKFHRVRKKCPSIHIKRVSVNLPPYNGFISNLAQKYWRKLVLPVVPMCKGRSNITSAKMPTNSGPLHSITLRGKSLSLKIVRYCQDGLLIIVITLIIHCSFNTMLIQLGPSETSMNLDSQRSQPISLPLRQL